MTSSKAVIVCCLLLLLSTTVTSISFPWSSNKAVTQSPYDYGNGRYYQPTTTKRSYIKNMLKGAAVGGLVSGAYTMYKNGK